jgi:hypothetical protein
MEDGKLQIIREKLEHAVKVCNGYKEGKKRVNGEERRVLDPLPMNV